MKTATTLAGILLRHGLSVERRASSLSSSVYLTVATPATVLRVRISDHVARPTYERTHGVADIEVGDHDMAACLTATDAAVRILTRLGPVPDRYLRAAIARDAKRQAARAAVLAAGVALESIAAATVGAQRAAFHVWAGDRMNPPAGASARQRKRYRQSLRRAYEAAAAMPAGAAAGL